MKVSRKNRSAALALTLLTGWVLQGCSNSNNNDRQRHTDDDISVRSLPWVGTKNLRLVDGFGREITVRGINARVEGLFDVTFDDGRIPLEPIPAFTREDAEAMARYGFNVLRLPINWSGLEPHEGEFSETYLEKLDQVIDLARDAGLYVLVDFHQDAWSKEIGEDGAPLWAIIPPPEMLLEGPLHDLAARRISPQVVAAYEGFFDNRENIQDRFLPAWRRIVGRYADRSEVIGFEPMNEPLVAQPNESQRALYDFYEKILPAMRELNERHLLWMEPSVLRNYVNSAPLMDEPFPDDNIVYTPHIYPSGADASTYEAWKIWLAENYARMKEEANSWGAALVVGEWGVHPDSPEAEGYIRAQQESADEFSSGQMLWLWKEDSQGSWGFYDVDEATGNWVVRENAVRLFAKPYAMAVPGTIISHGFNADENVLSVSFEAHGDEMYGPLLYLPETWFKDVPVISVNGSVVGYEQDAASQRVLLDWNGQKGIYTIEVH